MLSEADWSNAQQFEVRLKLYAGGTVTREFRVVKPYQTQYEEEVVLPAWVPPLETAEAEGGWNTRWDENVKQSRDTAKWTAVILGLALTALVGASPLSGLGDKTAGAFTLLAIALVLSIVVVALVLRVLSPTLISLTNLLPHQRRKRRFLRRKPDRDLKALRKRLEAEAGAQLPAGVSTVAELIGRLQLEQATLVAATEEAARASASSQEIWKKTLDARGSIYLFLQQQVRELLSLARFVRIQHTARRARRVGVPLGGLAILLVALAYLGPFAAPALHTYQLVQGDKATKQAQAQIGVKCLQFAGAITGHGPSFPWDVLSGQRLDEVAVQSGANCSSGLIVAPDSKLLRVAEK